MDHIDRFFNNFTLVTFSGGSMGTFFCNLVGEWNHPWYQRAKQSITGMNANFEWATACYFDHLYYRHYDPDLISLYRKKFGLGWEKYYLYAYALVAVDCLNKSIPSDNNFMSKIHDIDQHIKQEISNERIAFIAVKSHFVQKILLSKSVPWKYRVAPYFPDNKKWLQEVLLLWKRNLCEVDNLPPITSWRLRFEDVLRKIEEPEFLHTPIYENLKIDLIDSRRVNMYDLIFLNKIDVLYEAMPNFQLTDARKEILKKAQDTSHEIMRRLNVDHTLVAPPNVSFKEFLSDTNVPRYIEECKQMYRTSPL